MALSDTPSWVRFVDLVRNSSNALRYLFLAEQGAAQANPNTLSWTEIYTVAQVGIPNNTTIYGQCLLYGVNATDFAAPGDDFEVQIEVGGTTFQWRKNGGSWTTGVTIGAEVALGANGLKVSFLSTSGYTSGDTWKWERVAYLYSGSETTCLADVPRVDMYNTDIYISGVSRHILRLRNDFFTTIGYRRIYGKHAVIFANHLVVSQFAEAVYNSGAPSDPYSAATTPFNLGWSDLNNPDEFFATDINEADEYSIPSTDFPDTRSSGIMGLGKLGDLLYIYLSDAMYMMRYVGLPNVMQIDQAPFPKIGCRYGNSLVIAPSGHYFIGRNDIYFFDGVSAPSSIGEAVRSQFFSDIGGTPSSRDEWLFGYYDVGKEEVCWTYYIANGLFWQCRQMIYQERDKRWYFRNVPYIRCQGRLYGNREACVYGAYNAIYRDVEITDSVGIAAAVEDAVAFNGSMSFTEPTVTSHVTKYGLSRTIKEGDGQYIDAKLGTATHIEYAYKARNYVDQVLDSGFVVVANTWTPALKEGILTAPKIAAKCWQHRLTFKGTKVYGAKLNEWGDVGLTEGAEK
jgi:hypothetical protein